MSLSIQSYGNDLRDSRLLHRDTVQLVGRFHRPLAVRDDDELSILAHRTYHAGKTIDVGIVKGRIDLIQNTEWAGLELEQRDHKS